MNKTIFLILCLFGSIVCIYGESYSDTVSVNSGWTADRISWTHELPSNYTNITSLTLIIEAYDVNFKNVVTINDITVGNLNKTGTNQWGTTTLTLDANTLQQISNAHPSSLRVTVTPYCDWIKINTSTLTMEYVVDNGQGNSSVKAPIPLFSIILSIVFMSSIIYNKIK
ncbi:hypothetical protein [Methanotorris igneus]|uniref:Uncharacterized protein n=1 Tax=Methanotorris igneus (strain DSM 5666 / JCM 11834 / Kol 5) TaxID=880724 RepID=F6BE58_METIK|nr:hypothetical protein [Methanotorris igneus]AEF95594.1 hypothetical protein Metig_0033 [Methanotorris igneus Kol 5]